VLSEGAGWMWMSVGATGAVAVSNICSFKQTSNWRTQKQLSDTYWHTFYIVRQVGEGAEWVGRWAALGEAPPADCRPTATQMTNVLLIDLLTTSSWHLAAVSNSPEIC